MGFTRSCALLELLRAPRVSLRPLLHLAVAATAAALARARRRIIKFTSNAPLRQQLQLVLLLLLLLLLVAMTSWSRPYLAESGMLVGERRASPVTSIAGDRPAMAATALRAL
jgi:hypothetical protein